MYSGNNELSQVKYNTYNVYIRLITKDEMKRLTRSEDCSELKGDSLYLSWTMMKWNFIGVIREYNIEKTDLCSTDNSVSIFFPSNTISHIIDCKMTVGLICRNIPVGRVHVYLSQAEPGPGPTLQHCTGDAGIPQTFK